ncbi:3',5'-cyclic adenosine monophosphate phosphodiesterase CpdA [subsurface metagenome]
MIEKERSFWKKAVLALILRPPVMVVLLLGCLYVWGARSSDEVTVDERFALSSSIRSPYRNALKGSYQYSFAFCGDPHMRRDGDGCFPDLDKEIRAKRMSFVIFGGDLTFLGREDEYRNLVEHVNALTVPSYPALGNHDLYDGGWSYYWRYLGPSSYSFHGGNAKFVVIDAASGEIGEKQMAWIRNELKGNRQPLLFVVSHLPVYGGSHGRYDFPQTTERTELVELFERYGVDYVLEGHYHGYVDITVNGVRYITSGSFSDGLLDSGERHFLLFRVYGTDVTVEKIPVKSDAPVQYLDGVL